MHPREKQEVENRVRAFKSDRKMLHGVKSRPLQEPLEALTFVVNVKGDHYRVLQLNVEAISRL